MKIKLTVRNLGLEGTHFAWDVDPAHDDVLGLVEFHVEVGEGNGAEGPWHRVSETPIVNAFGYVSRKGHQYSVSSRTNYRVRAVNLAKDCEESYSNIISPMERPTSTIGRAIAKQERLALKRYVGSETLHYARMHFGERCGCYDPVLRKRMVPVCQKCFNTTFVGGYYYPTLIYITRSPINKAAEPMQLGLQENPMTEAWTSNNAIIEVDDLLITRMEHAKRYVVKQVQATTLQDAIVRQTLNLQTVRADDPEMMVPTVETPADLERDSVFRRHWSIG